jgi:S-phase kinase-associated protein 1
MTEFLEHTNSTNNTNNTNNIKLISSEDKVFTVPIENVKISGLINIMLENCENNIDDDNIEEIPILAVNTNILSRVIDFMEHMKIEPLNDIIKPLETTDITKIVQERYITFLNDKNDIHELINASNYMDIQPLLTLTCVKLATMIKDKSSEEIRQIFNIENDLTPEDEEQIREEEKWCEKD